MSLNQLAKDNPRIIVAENRRKFFRITYPKGAGPRMVARGASLEIVNISEQGIHFEPHNIMKFREGESFAGSISFESGESFVVIGVVKRIGDTGVSIELKKQIPLRIIMDEQRRLIRNFPKRA